MGKHVMIVLNFIFIFVAATSGVLAVDEELVNWPTVFNSDGTVQNLGSGLEAVFLPDNISAGLARDMTVLDGANNVVYNGTVDSEHDIGNGYVFAEQDTLGNLVITFAVERLNQVANTYIEIELNQAVVGVYSGEPWPLLGDRTPNDVTVRFIFIAGSLSNIEVGRWNGTTFNVDSYDVPSNSGCFVASADCDYCLGAPVNGLPPVNDQVWDNSYNRVQVPEPDSFLQARLNIGTLLGENIEFSSIILRTPQDISLGSFKSMGHWGTLNAIAAP